MKKILILYATAGIGHKKAAVAVKKAFDEISPKDIEVLIADSLDYTNALFKWMYLKVYLLMVNKLPFIWGLAYYITDNFYINLVVARLRRFNNWLNSFNLRRYLLDLRPDVIISTHFFASEVISDLKRSGAVHSHLITILTDYRLHSWWVSDFVDTYVVADHDAKEDLLRWGTASDKVKVIGIPVEPVFSKPLDKDKILKSIGFNRDVFTMLIIGGGFGVGPIEDIVKVIGSLPETIQAIVICGHNEELVKRIEALKQHMKANIKVLGFVDNVYEFMEIAHILISKSGGITVTESLARELPMVVISPIIGQETRNSDFLVKESAALKLNNLSELKAALEDLIYHPDKIDNMRKAIRRIKAPNACYDIAKMAYEIADRGR